MKTNKIKMVVLISIIICLASMMIYILVSAPILHMNGETNMTIEVFTPYEELGVEAKVLGHDIRSKVQIKGNVDTNKVGEYQVQYIVSNNGITSSLTRFIKVVDRTNPEITLIGEEEVVLCPLEEYVEEGYQAIDNYDGDITSNVTVKESKDQFLYSVFDRSGNKGEKRRTFRYEDQTPPTITLRGEANLTLYVGSTYEEKGVDVSDNCDDVSSRVEMTGSVDTNTAGTYTLTYTVTDLSGNQSSVVRTVTIKKRPTVIVPKNSTIYLTFDDGPSYLTPQILDILKEENVKATFFVVNHSSSYDKYIKRAYEEGHAIGIHSYTHNYKQIYASEEAYFNDLNLMRNKIYNITGSYTNLVRFPGGSSNTVSRFNPGIMTRLANKLTNQGYVYFDWNVSSGDAGEVTTATGVYQNVIGGLGTYHSYIVLMHDAGGKTYTVNALRDIIRTAKAKGYKFDKLSETSYPAHHRIAN